MNDTTTETTKKAPKPAEDVLALLARVDATGRPASSLCRDAGLSTVFVANLRSRPGEVGKRTREGMAKLASYLDGMSPTKTKDVSKGVSPRTKVKKPQTTRTKTKGVAPSTTAPTVPAPPPAPTPALVSSVVELALEIAEHAARSVFLRARVDVLVEDEAARAVLRARLDGKA